VFWRKCTQNVRGGNAWINYAAFVAIDAQEFHPIVLALARRLVKAKLPQRPPTLVIVALHASFAPERTHGRVVVSDELFRDSVPGYLRLELGRRIPGERFEVVVRGGEEYSILRGCYVSPWGRSILQDNEIDGLVLDTTWHVLRQQVTAIIMGAYCNVGVPLAFAFGVAETRELSEHRYTAFAELFGIDLSR
jgi:hypothetical protein